MPKQEENKQRLEPSAVLSEDISFPESVDVIVFCLYGENPVSPSEVFSIFPFKGGFYLKSFIFDIGQYQ